MCGSAYSQADSLFYINGKVEINVFGKIKFPIEPIFVVITKIDETKPNYHLEDQQKNDSALFRIDSLKSGKYKLHINCISIGSIDTIILIKDKSVENLYFLFEVNCNKWDLVRAEKDIENGIPKLLLVSNIETQGEKKFERKFHIKYCNFGDTPPDSFDCFASYNERIFKYLDNKYGRSWRRTVRKDVIGLTKYIGLPK